MLELCHVAFADVTGARKHGNISQLPPGPSKNKVRGNKKEAVDKVRVNERQDTHVSKRDWSANHGVMTNFAATMQEKVRSVYRRFMERAQSTVRGHDTLPGVGTVACLAICREGSRGVLHVVDVLHFTGI